MRCAGMFAGRRQESLTTGPKLRKLPELKRLSFVRAYSVYLSARVAAAYSSSRATLPGSWQQRVQQLEERVSTVGRPLWHNVHTASDRILWQLDSKVSVGQLCNDASAREASALQVFAPLNTSFWTAPMKGVPAAGQSLRPCGQLGVPTWAVCYGAASCIWQSG